eukprot:scaffold118137_cov32-Prasinocladus_malaysianus.AAC.1
MQRNNLDDMLHTTTSGTAIVRISNYQSSNHGDMHDTIHKQAHAANLIGLTTHGMQCHVWIISFLQ